MVNRYTPADPFFYIKEGFEGYTFHGHAFIEVQSLQNNQ